MGIANMHTNPSLAVCIFTRSPSTAVAIAAAIGADLVE